MGKSQIGKAPRALDPDGLLPLPLHVCHSIVSLVSGVVGAGMRILSYLMEMFYRVFLLVDFYEDDIFLRYTI